MHRLVHGSPAIPYIIPRYHGNGQSNTDIDPFLRIFRPLAFRPFVPKSGRGRRRNNFFQRCASLSPRYLVFHALSSPYVLLFHLLLPITVPILEPSFPTFASAIWCLLRRCVMPIRREEQNEQFKRIFPLIIHGGDENKIVISCHVLQNFCCN